MRCEAVLCGFLHPFRGPFFGLFRAADRVSGVACAGYARRRRAATLDIVGGRFDLALRIAALADSTLRARRVWQVRRLLVGSPAYFERRGRPVAPHNLISHACLGYAYLRMLDRWPFVDASGAQVVVVSTGPLRANNGDALRPALLAGLGIAVQPEFLVWEDLAASRLWPCCRVIQVQSARISHPLPCCTNISHGPPNGGWTAV